MSRNRLLHLSLPALSLFSTITSTYLFADAAENASLFQPQLPTPLADVPPATLADVHPAGDERPYDEQLSKTPPLELPWFTGPLLAPSGHVIPVGHYNIEPYLFANVATGVYDSHWKGHNTTNFYNINTEVPVQIGIFDRCDVTFTPQFSWNHTDGASHWVYNDMPFGLDYQIFYDTADKWPPAVKLALKANAPLGKYQKLNPNDEGTDIGGSGSWLPGVGLDFSRLFHFTGVHFLAARLALTYIFPTAVHVKGFNAYGGGDGTHGKVYPGQIFSADLGLEYTLARRWALALDVLYVHANHTRFSGQKGTTDGVPNSVGGPSSEQLSLAPAIEYNWNGNYGIIAGVWFSVAGRNTAEFINGVIAFNIYH